MRDHTATVSRLAAWSGIADSYHNVVDGGVVHTTHDTRVALLGAMRVDASSPGAAAEELRQVEEQERIRFCEPVSVQLAGDAQQFLFSTPATAVGSDARLQIRLEHGEELDLAFALPEMNERVKLQVQSGAGADWSMAVEGGMARSDRPGAREYKVTFDTRLPAGYNSVVASVNNIAAGREHSQMLVVTPGVCTDPIARLGAARGCGIATNLYSVPDRSGVGIGSLGTLRNLARWLQGHGNTLLRTCSSERSGPDFVGVNPMHALGNRGYDISPYSPSSRLFRNIVYLELSAIPELATSERARTLLSESRFVERSALLRGSAQVEYEAVLELMLPPLRELHREFVSRRGDNGTRCREWEGYLQRDGPLLRSFATFQAICEELTASGYKGASDARLWPEKLRDPTGRAVEEFARSHADAVDFHMYLQFELDRQLRVAHEEMLGSGMRIGLYADLALGSAPSGFDSWRFARLHAHGASIGAPPDPFATDGQSWGMPPLIPHEQRADAYRYFAATLRCALHGAGMVRIDHVMGFWRQFWVPDGSHPREGAYVHYPHSELLGILALESTRANAVIVGEDLGTVPDEVRPEMAARQMLRSTVLWFERDASGEISDPMLHPEMALASVNTHDLPTLPGWWLGYDLAGSNDIRTAEHADHGSSPANMVYQPDYAQAQQAARWHDRHRVLTMLKERGWLSEEECEELLTLAASGVAAEGEAKHSAVDARHADTLLQRLSDGVHGLLATSSAILVSLSLDDLMLERQQVNRPGVPLTSYRSWSRKMRAIPGFPPHADGS